VKHSLAVISNTAISRHLFLMPKMLRSSFYQAILPKMVPDGSAPSRKFYFLGFKFC